MGDAKVEQTARFQTMTPEERWQAAMRLYWSMRKLKASYVRAQHPEWSDEEVDLAVKRAFTNVRD